MQETFTISELGKEFGITTRAIRFYEDKKLLSPIRDGQKRIYTRSDRTRLKLLLRGNALAGLWTRFATWSTCTTLATPENFSSYSTLVEKSKKAASSWNNKRRISKPHWRISPASNPSARLAFNL